MPPLSVPGEILWQEEVAARLRRFAGMLNLTGDVRCGRDPIAMSTIITMEIVDPPIIFDLVYEDIKMFTGEQPTAVPVSVFGRPYGSAPNPAVSKRDFLEWLKKLISGRDTAPKKSLTRGEWMYEHGDVPQCFKCGLPMREVASTNGPFWGCTGFKSNGCKGSLNINSVGRLSPRCPDCGYAMALRNGTKGDFWSCGNYPSCKRTMDKSVGDGLSTTVADWMPDHTGRGEATAMTGRAVVPVAASAGMPPSESAEPDDSPKPSLDALRARYQRRS